MYLIAALGLLTIVLSLMMIVSPAGWAKGILTFSEQRYFHIFEIVSRLLLGVILIGFGGDTLHPRLWVVLGYVMFAVAVLLVVMGSKRHRAFAEKSSTFERIFRPAGFFSLAFGVFVIYSAIGRYWDGG